MTYSVTRTKISSLAELMQSTFDDLEAAGFTPVLPTSGGTLTLTGGAGKFVFDSSEAVNPVNENQSYRILFDLFSSESGSSLRVAIATPDQISSSGQVSDRQYTQTYTATPTPVLIPDQGANTIGQLGTKWDPRPYAPSVPGPAYPGLTKGDVFISHDGVRNVVVDDANTMGYLMSVTDHGIVYFVWRDSTESLPIYSMFCVQSPVNKDTGAPLTDLNSPIFCVYNADNTGYKKFVVNESDNGLPTVAVSAEEDSVNSNAILNAEEQVSVKGNNKYLITFPNRINTDRYAYSEELDMFAYTSADVIGEGSVVPVNNYGEVEPRSYRAMKANGPNNTKMRLLVLVPEPQVP